MNRSRVTADLASHGNIFVDIANDRVGIGSTIPTHKIDVSGTVKLHDHTGYQNHITYKSSGPAPHLHFPTGPLANLARTPYIGFGDRGDSSGDFKIYHDHYNAHLKLNANFGGGYGAGLGGLFISNHSTSGVIGIQGANGSGAAQNSIYIPAGATAGVKIFQAGELRFETVGYGVTVLGTTETQELNVTGVSTFSGDLSISDTIVHTGDTNTKIRFPAADTISMETAGSERLRIDSSGNIGVNVTPVTSGTLYNTVDHFLVIGDNDTGIAQDGDGQFEIWANNQEIANFNTTGVTLTTGLTVGGVTRIGNSSGSLGINCTPVSSGGFGSNTSKFAIGDNDTGLAQISDGVLAFYTNNAEVFRINGTKKFMIGTTTEGAVNSDDLTIATSGDTGITIRSGTTSNGVIHFSDATSGVGEYAGFIDYDHNTNYFQMGTNSSRFLSADSDLVVAIGKPSFGGASRVIAYGGAGGIDKNSLSVLNPTASVAGRGAGVAVGGNTDILGSFYAKKSGNADSDGGDVFLESVGAMSFITNGDLTNFTNNTSRLTITSAGNIGVGIDNPAAKLEAYGADAAITVHYTSHSRGGIAAFTNQRLAFVSTHVNDDLVFGYSNNPPSTANFVERMRIDSGTGNVGIGTDNVDAKLKVRTEGVNQTMFTLEADMGTNNNRTLYIKSPTTDSASEPFTFHTGNSIQFMTDANIGLKIASNGNVGINESSPLGKLHVKSGDSGVSAVGSSADELVLESATNAGMSILSATNGEGGINFGDSGDINIGKIAYNHDDNAMFFKTSDIERLRIDASGNIRHQKSSANPNFTLSRNASIGNDNQVIGTIDFASNTAHTVQARIMARNHGTNNVGGYLVVETREEGGSLTEKFQIAGSGKTSVINAELAIESSASYTTHLNYNNTGSHYISMADAGATYFRGSSNGITALTVYGGGGINVNGNITAGAGAFTGNIDLNSDINKLKLGAGDDFQLYHNGSNNFIETNVGDIRIKTSAAANITFTTGGNTERWRFTSGGDFVPAANDTYDIGSTSAVVRNLFTGDLHLNNLSKEKGNDVDGTNGSWTIQEGQDDLYIINKLNGKKYRIPLEEVN